MKNKEIIQKLERIKLDLDVGVCSCGEKLKDTDVADLVDEWLAEITNPLK